MTGEPRFTVVVPMLNEADNVELLAREIAEACTSLGRFEAIFVNDGSSDATAEAIKQKTATGFCFYYASGDALLRTIGHALALYAQTPKWRSVARTGMAQVFDWRSSARKYLALYKETVKRP